MSAVVAQKTDLTVRTENDGPTNRYTTDVETVPSVFERRVSSEELAWLEGWLSEQGQTPSIVLVPQMLPQLAEELRRGMRPDQRADFVRTSAEGRFRVVQEAIDWADQRSGVVHGRDTIYLPHLHACVIRRPKRQLLELLRSTLCSPERGIIADIIPNVPLRSPEYGAEVSNKSDAKARRERLEEVVRNLPSHSDGYMNSLGVGDFREPWGCVSDDDQPVPVCILDSGADESHVALRQKILVHAAFDGHGQFKHAQDAVDRGCHGTKVTGIVAARQLIDVARIIPRSSPLRIGVCPHATVAAVSVSQGNCFAETGTLSQLLAGMDWAVENKSHPKWGGFELINISLELESPHFATHIQPKIDATIEQLMYHSLLPVFASGNGGPKCIPFSKKGIFVGGVDASGKPDPRNGPRAEMLAPSEQICCQPPLATLEHDLLSVYSGSSLASAFVVGLISVLVGKKKCSAQRAAEALRATVGANGQVRPEEAFKCL